MLQIQYAHLPEKERLYILWIHEATRVFHDRLADQKDRDWFFQQMKDNLVAFD